MPRTNADDKDIEKFEVKYGDMLFCRSSLVAEGIGKASIIPEDVQENIFQSSLQEILKRIKPFILRRLRGETLKKLTENVNNVKTMNLKCFVLMNILDVKKY